MNNLLMGKAGEQAALQYLKKNKYKIVEKNYRLRNAEVDIIAWDNKTLCFVEVKTRKNNAFGNPCEAVDFRKQQKIITAATRFIADNNIDACIRFDVVEVYAKQKLGKIHIFNINLIKNAFDNS